MNRRLPLVALAISFPLLVAAGMGVWLVWGPVL